MENTEYGTQKDGGFLRLRAVFCVFMPLCGKQFLLQMPFFHGKVQGGAKHQ